MLKIDTLSVIYIFFCILVIIVFVNTRLKVILFERLLQNNTSCGLIEKQDKTGLKLLKIVAILLIISFHYFYHGGLYKETNSINILLVHYLRQFDVGVNCFVLISGYFLIEPNQFRWRKLLKLWLTVAFYSCFFYLAEVFFFKSISFTGTSFLKVILPIRYSQYWFISVYFGLYLLSPYLGKLVRSLSQKEYLRFLIIIIGTFSIYSFYIPGADPFGINGGFRSVVWFAVVFCVGGYFRLFPVAINKKQALFIYFFFAILTGCLHYAIWLAHDFNLIRHGSFWLLNNSPTFFLSAVGLFLFFNQCNIKSELLRKIINTVSSFVLGIYLIHDNLFMKGRMWKEWLHATDYYNSPYLLLHWIISVLLVFMACIFVEYIRQKLFKIIWGK